MLIITSKPQKAIQKQILPYIKGTSEMAGRLLQPLGTTTAHKPMFTRRKKLTKVKDRRKTVPT